MWRNIGIGLKSIGGSLLLISCLTSFPGIAFAGYTTTGCACAAATCKKNAQGYCSGGCTGVTNCAASCGCNDRADPNCGCSRPV